MASQSNHNPQVSTPKQAGHARVAEAGSFIGYGASASVVVPSAEGVTTYRGAEGDPSKQTLRWLNDAFAEIQERHSRVNATLVDPEPGR